ncbi:MAG: FecR domain-containing protein [Chitinophagaceae bacterium]
MQQEKIHPDILTSAICKMSAGVPLTNDEKDAYDVFISSNEYLRDIRVDSELMSLMADDQSKDIESFAGFLEQHKDRIEQLEQQQYMETHQPVHKQSVPLVRRLLVAACVIAILGLSGTLLYNSLSQSQPVVKTNFSKSDTLPAHGGRATLILADNRSILLGTIEQGKEIATQGNVTITKTDSGQISYRFAGNGSNNDTRKNQLTVPRSGTYTLELSDGSKVYLNAESTINYPASFDSDKREVTLEKGEAYFEIKHDKNNRPFIVNVNGTKNLVLGTRFNIRAYDNEAQVAATLLQGSLNVSKDKQEYTLLPGQQTIYKQSTGKLYLDTNANTSDVIAWKNGLFSFEDDADIKTIMQEAERWYNVKITYKDSNINFKGDRLYDFRRKETLETFMRVISLEGEKFKYKVSATEVIISK